MLSLSFQIVNYRAAGLATSVKLCKTVTATDTVDCFFFFFPKNKQFSQVPQRLISVEGRSGSICSDFFI